MTSAAILKRLEALESRKRNTYVAPKPPPLSLYIVALVAGKWQAHESPADAYHRGVGCQNAAEFHKLSAERVAERHRKAWGRICKRRGIDPETLQPWDAAARKFKKLDKAGIVPDATWGAA
jgi:hypothetical protein